MEIYGIEDYLNDIYNSSICFDKIKDNINNTIEEEIGFTFLFEFEVKNQILINFIKFLVQERFYY